MRKKRGGNNEFIRFLIQDNAEALAFYFMINGYNKLDKINKDELNKYFDMINDGYNKIKDYLNHIYIDNFRQNSINYNYLEMIIYFGSLYFNINNDQFNINKYNYGTNGHIVKYMNEPFDLNLLKYFINNSNSIINDDRQYTLSNYIEKNGGDIAIYEYVYNKKISVDFLKQYFYYYFENFYKNFNIENFIKDLNLKYYKIRNFIQLDKSNINKRFQQYYNIYKYGYDILYDYNTNSNINIFYNNVRILTCNIPENLKNETELLNDDLYMALILNEDSINKYNNRIDNYELTSRDIQNIKNINTDYNKGIKSARKVSIIKPSQIYKSVKRLSPIKSSPDKSSPDKSSPIKSSPQYLKSPNNISPQKSSNELSNYRPIILDSKNNKYRNVRIPINNNMYN